MENAFQHKNLLAARMHVRIEVGVRCPAHQCATDAIVFVQRQHAEAGNQATVPLGLPGIKANGFGVAGANCQSLTKMVQPGRECGRCAVPGGLRR